MQSVAQGWLVLRLSDSPLALGFVGFCTFAPILLFALVAGVAADRVPRRKALMWTQGAAMLLALVLAALTWSDVVRVWQVALIAFGVGIAGAFDIPIRQSLLQDLVGREDLPNAIALNSLAFNGARLIGPAVGGFVLAAWGEASVFLINGLSYLAVLISLVRMRLEPLPENRRTSSWVLEIREGIHWVKGNSKARVFLTLVMVTSVFGLPYTILLPIFARDILDVGSRGLGFMTGATGLGAMIGALYLAGRDSTQSRGGLIASAIGLLGASLIAFSLSRSFALSLGLLVLIGAAMIAQLATSNTLLQLLAPAELRGRVVGYFMLAFMGMAPLGSLLAGLVARGAGTPAAVLIGGAVCLVTGVWFATRLPALRRATRAREAAAATPD